MASSLPSVAVYLHPSILLPYGLLPSKLTTHGQSIPLADPHEAWLSSMDLMNLAQPVALTTVEKMWRMQWKSQTVGTLKETGCHSWKIVFKEIVQLGASSLLVLLSSHI